MKVTFYYVKLDTVFIKTKKDKEIKRVFSVYCCCDLDDISFEIKYVLVPLKEGDKQFKICVKNCGNDERILKIQYHIIF